MTTRDTSSVADAIRDVLKPYVQHKPECPRAAPRIKLDLGPGWTQRPLYVKPCSCGLDAALVQIDALLQQPEQKECEHCHGTGTIRYRCQKCERQFVHDQCDGYEVECTYCEFAQSGREPEGWTRSVFITAHLDAGHTVTKESDYRVVCSCGGSYQQGVSAPGRPPQEPASTATTN